MLFSLVFSLNPVWGHREQKTMECWVKLQHFLNILSKKLKTAHKVESVSSYNFWEYASPPNEQDNYHKYLDMKSGIQLLDSSIII